MKITNGTPHDIHIYDAKCLAPHPEKRGAFLKGSQSPVTSVLKGAPLNAVKANAPAPEGDYGVPVVGAVVFIDADPLPVDGIVICSQMYRAALKELGRDTSRVATISGPVYDGDSPRPCGCTSLAVG